MTTTPIPGRRGFGAPAIALTLALAWTAAAAAAADKGRLLHSLSAAAAPASAMLVKARAAAETSRAALAPARLEWTGEDVDGDGAADFANPTGAAPRAHDSFGSGAWHAARVGRAHEGVDYAGRAGQAVAAPISGRVTRIGLSYADDSLTYVEITNDALGYVARAHYVVPAVQEGDMVRLGQPLGQLATLQRRYPGITDHVHLEISRGGARLDPGRVIVARLARPGSAAG